ncbi:hypothetical protein K1719_008330 [Acacia pycnantha]|nr:hypothetical protein K1719_008330 [Acacia pycnantha]
MAITTKLSASAFLAILFANLLALSSTTEPMISASPGILPYAAAPEASSLSPSPTADGPVSSTGQPEADSSAILAPSSGEFLVTCLLNSVMEQSVPCLDLCIVEIPRGCPFDESM